MRVWTLVAVVCSACGGASALDLPEEYIEGDGEWTGNLSASVACNGPTSVVSVSGPPGDAKVTFEAGQIVDASGGLGSYDDSAITESEMWSGPGYREGWFEVASAAGPLVGEIRFLLHCAEDG